MAILITSRLTARGRSASTCNPRKRSCSTSRPSFPNGGRQGQPSCSLCLRETERGGYRWSHSQWWYRFSVLLWGSGSSPGGMSDRTSNETSILPGSPLTFEAYVARLKFCAGGVQPVRVHVVESGELATAVEPPIHLPRPRPMRIASRLTRILS